jgi:hypothetical protein
MRGLKAAAFWLPVLSGLAMGALRIADWALWGSGPREAAPLLWRGIDWLMYPFALAGLPLLAPTMWIWSWIAPVVSRLAGSTVAQNGAAFVIVPCLLFALYLGLRGRGIAAGDLCRASGAGTAAIILFALLSSLSVKGSGDGQAGLGLVMGHNGGLLAAVGVAEWVLRRRKNDPPD